MKFPAFAFILILITIPFYLEGICQHVNYSSPDFDLSIKNIQDNYKTTPHLKFFNYWDETSNWEEIGPLTSSNNSTYDIGRLSTLCIDPENDSIILVGSPSGGLYYTITKGDTWINAGLDRPKEGHNLNMFTPGIASIAIIHENGKTFWIIATGDKDQNFNFSRGVIRSTDYGKSWDLIMSKFQRQLVVCLANVKIVAEFQV